MSWKFFVASVGFGRPSDRVPQQFVRLQARPNDMSVVLVTGSYDHEIRFWEAWSGICSRTIARSGESGVSFPNVNLDLY